MKTLDRYLLHSFLVNYFLSLFVLISLYVVLDLFVNLDEFTKHGKGVFGILYDAADYYFYNLPLYFAQLSGVITAFAACGTLARLQKQNEITAILASGTSLFRLATPIIAAGLIMNTLVIIDYEMVLPKVAPKIARSRDDVEGNRVYELWFVRDGDRRLINGLQFSPRLEAISDLIVMELSDDAEQGGRLKEVLRADRAQWDPDRKGWALTPREGRRFTLVEDPGGGLFGRHYLDMERSDFFACNLTPEELQLRQTRQWMAFLSTRQLNLLAQRGDINPQRIAQIKHGRFTLPISNMILLLLGMSFFMQRLPGSVLTQGAKALGVCGVAFLVTFVGQQLMSTVGVDPMIPAWLPIFIFAPLAVLLLDNVKT